MPALDSKTWAAIARRIAKGHRAADVARDYGIHPATLRRRLKKTAPSSARSAVPSSTRSVAPAAAARPAPPVKAARGPAPKRPPPSRKARRQLVDRLYQAIDTKLKLMERRMNSEIRALEAVATEEGGASVAPALSAADHERETRAFGALVKTINSVRQMQAELDHIADNAPPAASAADARLAADADRYRRDIAQRLAKFVPPQS